MILGLRPYDGRYPITLVLRLPKPVKRARNIKAEAAPKQEQYHREGKQHETRKDSKHPREIDNAADGDVLVCHR